MIWTGKEGATLPIKGVGRVTLQWGVSVISLDNCLYIPDILINLISAGALLEKGCELKAKKGTFDVTKDGITRFKVTIENNLCLIDNPNSVGGTVGYTHFSDVHTVSLRSIHESFGHASIQRLDQFIPALISKAEKDNFE